MAIKLIVTDLDGTFLNTNHITIPPENIEAFKRAHDMGIKLAIASGRTKILTGYVLEQLPFIDYLVTSNGAVSYDLHTGKVVCSTLLENSQSIGIFEVLKDCNLIYEIYFDGKCYMNEKSYSFFDPQHIPPHIYELLKDFITPVSSLETLIDGQGIEKLNILSLSGDERIELEVKINRLGEIAFASSFPIVKGANGNLEMTNKNATKGFAVKGLCNALNIDHTNVMCFGDGENDCSMLDFADYSFAMANGNDLAKNSAKYITDSNDNFGVAKAINKYVFGE